MKGYHDSKTPESIRDLWKTPKEIFNYYDYRFEFSYDLAASDANALCGLYCTAEDSALERDPRSFQMGAVFCNPPYSDITPWVDACVNISKGSDVPVIMLLPADTSVKWFKLAFDNCSECHFISGRLAFISEESGKPVAGNNKGSVVFVFDSMSPVRQCTVLLDRDEIMGK